MTGKRRIVLGIGNLLCRDEGVGLHALRALEAKISFRDKVELIDGGVLGLGLLPLVESCSHLLVLDAVDADLPPGSVIQLHGSQLISFARTKLSEHQLSFQEVLGLVTFRGNFPEKLELIGVQPADFSPGIDLSPEASQAIEEVIRRAKNIISSWFIE